MQDDKQSTQKSEKLRLVQVFGKLQEVHFILLDNICKNIFILAHLLIFANLLSQKIYDNPFLTKPSSTSSSVHIHRLLFGKIIVNDHIHLLDIYSSPENISSHHYLRSTFLEQVINFDSFRLRQLGMNADRIKELHTKLFCYNHRFLDHIQKDNDLFEFYSIQYPYQLAQLLFFTGYDIIMGQVTRIHFFILKLKYKRSFGLLHYGYAVFTCLFCECGSKQQHLFGFGRISKQELEIFQILVVINDSITLVNHKIFHMVSPDMILGNQMSHSPQSSNYYMWSKILCFQLVFTIPKRQSSEVACYSELRFYESDTQFSELYENLVGQLPCTDRHNAMVGKVFTVTLWSEHIENGKDIDCSFSCPRFCLTKHITVLVSYYLGYYFILNFSRILKTDILDSNHEFWFELQITPFYEGILPILYFLDSVWLYQSLVFWFLNSQYLFQHSSPLTNNGFLQLSKLMQTYLQNSKLASLY